MEKMIIEGTEIERDEMPQPEESLISLEKLDRASPDLWPEHSITKFVTQNNGNNGNNSNNNNDETSINDSSSQVETLMWSSNFTTEDINQLHQLSSLTVHELIVEVKKLHDTAYQLGLEEAKEMTRGKYLNIFKQESRD